MQVEKEVQVRGMEIRAGHDPDRCFCSHYLGLEAGWALHITGEEIPLKPTKAEDRFFLSFFPLNICLGYSVHVVQFS